MTPPDERGGGSESADEGAAREVVGPVPPGVDAPSYDRLRRRVLWSLPTGLYLLGTAAGPRYNLMTISWVTQVATDPKLVAVSVESASVTRGLIEESGVFALSILGRADRIVVRRFVKPLTESDVAMPQDGTPGTLRDLDVRREVTGAPIVAGAVAWLDCTVWSRQPLGSHVLVVGEVVASGPDDYQGGAEVLRMEDTRMNYGG